MRNKCIVLIILLNLSALLAHAQRTGRARLPFGDGPKFGPEFTFSDPLVTAEEFGMHEYIKYLLQAWRPIHQQKSSQWTSREAEHLEEFWIVSPDKWEFLLHIDPGVIEVSMSPLKVREFEKYAAEMQVAIFDSAKAAGLAPQYFLGGGHINIDYNFLINRPLLFRNLLADLLVNHAELFMGVFGYDTNNALPLIMASPDVFAKLTRVFKKFDKVKSPQRANIERLVEQLQDIILSHEDEPYSVEWDKGDYAGRPEKFFSFYLAPEASVEDEDSEDQTEVISRLELRGVRPQASVDVWVRQIRLLKKRMQHLDKLNKPVRLKMPFDLNKSYAEEGSVTQDQMLNPPITGVVALENFKRFVEESGEKIEDHLDYVWPAWQTDGSVETFKLKYGIGNSDCQQLLNPSPRDG